MPQATHTGLTSADIQELITVVAQLSEETRLNRIAIDEIRDDIIWAARQVLAAGYQVTGTPPPAPRDSFAADTPPRVEPTVDTEPDLSTTNELLATSPVVNDPAATPDTIVPQSPCVAEQSVPVATTSRKAPLHTRLYFREYLTAVVRAFGYEELARDEALRRLDPLIELHGKPDITAAVDELVELTPDNRWRLTAHVRQLAIGILGRPKLPDSVASVHSNFSPSTVYAAPAPIAENIPRNLAIQRYAQFLTERGLTFTTVDAAFRRRYPDRGLNRLDFVVHASAGDTLVTVQRKLPPPQQPQILTWLDALGPARVTRVWPIQCGDESGWDEVPIDLVQLAERVEAKRRRDRR